MEKNDSGEWPVLTIDRQRRGSLVDQIVAAIAEMVNRRTLPAGTKMPSVRQFAKVNGVSTFTVVESYDRLMHLGLLSSRRGSGFFVARGTEAPAQQACLPASASVVDTLTPDLYSGQSDALPVGAGWLPPEWYGESTILDAVRHAMKIPAGRLRGYGHPLGFPSLRQHLAASLSAELFAVEPEQILLTHGATHAFDLVLRTLTRPGDVVFVEDPGYGNLLALVRHHGCVAVGIPRGAQGLDMDVLAREAQARQPKLMFVNTVLQNPLGTSLSQAQAHRLLALSEQFDFWLVEDDIYRELAARGESSLAAMDGLRRVIRIGSFSKTLSPVLRRRQQQGLPQAGRTPRAPARRRARTGARAPGRRRPRAAGKAARRDVRQRGLAGHAAQRPRHRRAGTARRHPAGAGRILFAASAGIRLVPLQRGLCLRAGPARLPAFDPRRFTMTTTTVNAVRTATAKRRAVNRDKVENAILGEAVRQFAECGYEGTSIATVAERAGLSKQNLMYYFPTKQALYERVLDNVLDDWLARMASLSDPSKEPGDVLRGYVRAKLKFSREQPLASRVYAMEVIGGAKLYADQIRRRVIPLLRADIAVFERWIADGKIAPVNATHLLFAVWAMTQSYADFAAQMTLVLDREQLQPSDFDDAERLITSMVLAAVGLQEKSCPP
jgi:AcrR family transcriptional regulator/DNA-binding transcriptional regulator YhcF (GntR family)